MRSQKKLVVLTLFDRGLTLRTTVASLLAIGAAAGQASPPRQPSEWQLVWSDEFNGVNGTAPDPKNWTHDTGGNGWGNQELQYYTDRVAHNVVVQDGTLAIRAQRETYTGPDGVTIDLSEHGWLGTK